jgi:hypothetical protein
MWGNHQTYWGYMMGMSRGYDGDNEWDTKSEESQKYEMSFTVKDDKSGNGTNKPRKTKNSFVPKKGINLIWDHMKGEFRAMKPLKHGNATIF